MEISRCPKKESKEYVNLTKSIENLKIINIWKILK